MIRRIVHIDEEKCNGCGLCAQACHESAIGMVNGKAKLLRDDYCDGLGDCLPACPAGAISFIEEKQLHMMRQQYLKIRRKGSSGPSGSCRRMSWHPYAPDEPQKRRNSSGRRKYFQCSTSYFPVKQLVRYRSNWHRSRHHTLIRQSF